MYMLVSRRGVTNTNNSTLVRPFPPDAAKLESGASSSRSRSCYVNSVMSVTGHSGLSLRQLGPESSILSRSGP